MSKGRKFIPSEKRRGNTTSGEDRRGFRGGRKPINPPGTVLVNVLLSLNDEQAAIAVTLGAGILAKGVRCAIAIAGKTLPPETPKTRAEAQLLAYEKRVRENKARAAAVRASLATTTAARVSKYGAPPSKEELARLMAFYKAKRLADQAAGVTEPADDEDENEVDNAPWDDLGSDEEPTT